MTDQTLHCREAFEKWALGNLLDITWIDPIPPMICESHYYDNDVMQLWLAWQAACEWMNTRAQASALDDRKLDKPALVGHAQFGVGVAWSTVIGAAQRLYEWKDDKLSPEQIAAFYIAFPHLAPSKEKVERDDPRSNAKAGEVDEAMIERAWAALDATLNGKTDGIEYAYGDSKPMRAALEAAISTQRGDGSEMETSHD